MRAAPHRIRPGQTHGFTLVEIMIVVVIIGLLAALAIPAFQRVQRAAKNGRVINDFRVFAQAFETYSMINGTWPGNVTAGVIPTSPVPMTGDFKADVWQGTTAIGGRWNWDNSTAGGGIAGISIQNFTADDDQLTEIDTKIDDGDLSTGNFQKVSTNKITLIMVHGT